MDRTPHSQCRRPKYSPWSGGWIHIPQLRVHMPQLKEKIPHVLQWKRKKEEWVFLFPFPEHKKNKDIREQTWTFLLFLLSLKVTQSCPTLCNPMDHPVHEILQAHTVHGILQTQNTGVRSLYSSGEFPNLGIEPRSPALQADSLPVELSGKPFYLSCS